MSDTSPQRGSRPRGDLVRCESGRAIGRRKADRDQPRRVATWARALAAVVLLDPSALPGGRPTARRTMTAGQRTGTAAASARPPTNRSHADDPVSESVPRTGRAAAGRDAPTVLAVIDAAAALIQGGDEDSAFLLLALAEPAPQRPTEPRGALPALTSTRRQAAACTPGGRSPARTVRRVPRGGRGGPA